MPLLLGSLVGVVGEGVGEAEEEARARREIVGGEVIGGARMSRGWCIEVVWLRCGWKLRCLRAYEWEVRVDQWVCS